MFQTGALRATLIGFALLCTCVSQAQAQTFRPIPSLSFTKVFAGSNPLSQVVTVTSTAANFNFRVTSSTASGGTWLSVAGCGSYCSTPQAIIVTVNPGAALAAGTYTGQVVLTEYYNSFSFTIPVSLTIAATGTAYPDSLPGHMSFSLSVGGAAPPAQTVQLRNGGSGSLNWTLTSATSDGGNWLSVSASSGAAPSTVSVSVNPANLPDASLVAGTFSGHLTFTTAGGSETVPISVTVDAVGIRQTQPLSFNRVFGGANPLPQVVTLSSTGTNFNVRVQAATSGGGDWLTVSGCGSYCSTPQALIVEAKPGAALAAGTYMGQIIVTEYYGARAMTIPVTLVISAPGTTYFDNVPGHVSFSVSTGGAGPPAQTLQIRNAGAGTLNWTATATTSDSGAWLSVSPATGAAPSLVTIAINVANLPNAGLVAGTFIGHILFQANGIGVTVPVSVVVGTSAFRQVNAISFTKPFGLENPLPQMLTIANVGTDFNFRVAAFESTGASWLTVSGCGSYCSTPQAITVEAKPGPALAPGTYTGEIVLTEYYNTMAMTVPVTLTVLQPATNPLFDNLPGQMSFSIATGTGNPAAQPLQIRNAGAGALNWSVSTSTSDGGNWLTVSAPSGTAPSTVSVSVSANALPNQGLVAGTFNGELVFRADGTTSTVTIPVSVVVGASVFSSLQALNFTMPSGGTNPLPQTLNVSSTGTNFNFRAVPHNGKGGNWLTVSGCGSYCGTPRAITATVAPPAGLGAGTYTGQIVLTEYYNTAAMTVPVTLTVTAPPSCTIGLTPATRSLGADGGSTNFTLTATGGTPCNWTASSNASWAQVFPLSGTGAGNVSVNVFPNFRTTARTAIITVQAPNGILTFTINQAAGIGTSQQRYVKLLYYFFFGRIPPQADIDFQVNSGLARRDLAWNFFRGGEFLLGGRFVGGLYVGILERDSEYGGWAFQRNALASGGSPFRQQLVENFLNSAEFRGKYPNLDNAGLIRLLYKNVLGRTNPPSQAEVDFHLGLLAAGQTRAQKTIDFLASGEFAISSDARLTTTLLYSTLLQRNPTAQERETMMNRIRSGVTVITLIEELIGTPEFGNIVN